MSISLLPEVQIHGTEIVVGGSHRLTSDGARALAALLESSADLIERADRESKERQRIAAIPSADRSQRELTDGSPVPEDGSHTENRGDGQQKGYVVLTATERAKGFVRPVRRSYKHVGPPGPKFPLRDLTDEEREHYGNDGYVKYEPYPETYKGSSVVGRYWTQEQLDATGKGCGTVTTMGQSIAETYARDPKFYSGTFCCGCGTHLTVGETGEFVWLDDGTRVGT